LVIVAVSLQTKKAILADLHDPLRACVETDDERPGKFLDGWRQRDPRPQMHVPSFYAAIGQVDRGRRLGCARDPYEHDVRFLKPLRMLAVIMQHGEVQSIDALEIFRIQHVLGASPMYRLCPEIRLKQAQDRPENRHTGQSKLAAFFFQRFYEVLFQESVQNQTRGFPDLGKRVIELFFRPHHRIQMLDWRDIRVLRSSSPRDRYQGFAGSVRYQVYMEITGLRHLYIGRKACGYNGRRPRPARTSKPAIVGVQLSSTLQPMGRLRGKNATECR